jgi:hypothetical protein
MYRCGRTYIAFSLESSIYVDEHFILYNYWLRGAVGKIEVESRDLKLRASN